MADRRAAFRRDDPFITPHPQSGRRFALRPTEPFSTKSGPHPPQPEAKRQTRFPPISSNRFIRPTGNTLEVWTQEEEQKRLECTEEQATHNRSYSVHLQARHQSIWKPVGSGEPACLKYMPEIQVLGIRHKERVSNLRSNNTELFQPKTGRVTAPVRFPPLRK